VLSLDSGAEMSQLIVITLQIIIALGLLNVWLLRANQSTGYRGGIAKTIKEEFAVYGLPEWFCYAVGLVKVSCAILLLVALWYPSFRQPAALIISVLMLGAVLMHAKVGDPLKKTLPAVLMLIMTVVVWTIAR